MKFAKVGKKVGKAITKTGGKLGKQIRKTSSKTTKTVFGQVNMLFLMFCWGAAFNMLIEFSAQLGLLGTYSVVDGLLYYVIGSLIGGFVIYYGFDWIRSLKSKILD